MGAGHAGAGGDLSVYCERMTERKKAATERLNDSVAAFRMFRKRWLSIFRMLYLRESNSFNRAISSSLA